MDSIESAINTICDLPYPKIRKLIGILKKSANRKGPTLEQELTVRHNFNKLDLAITAAKDSWSYWGKLVLDEIRTPEVMDRTYTFDFIRQDHNRDAKDITDIYKLIAHLRWLADRLAEIARLHYVYKSTDPGRFIIRVEGTQLIVTAKTVDIAKRIAQLRNNISKAKEEIEKDSAARKIKLLELEAKLEEEVKKLNLSSDK
jgi:hypothetical protein